MGIIWRFAMPLLTTLAALVIIVHSAEEDLEAEYRHDLRPRVLDTGTQNYQDQPWRVMEADPPVPQSRQADNWDDSPDDIPRRRRSGRKRKRRPQTVSAEELLAEEGRGYPEDPPRPIFDVDFDTVRQTTENVKRRRKKPENRPTRWTDDVLDIERPMRRKAQRRKRPSLNAWPELAEFSNADDILPVNLEASPEIVEPVNTHNSQNDNLQAEILQMFEDDHVTKQTTSTLKLEPVINTELPLVEDVDGTTEKSRYLLENKSLSEFSGEFPIPPKPRPTLQQLKKEKKKNRTSEVFRHYDKFQDNLMDPPTLKDILKRSNGTSLSEILQQHNLSLTDLLRGNQRAVSIFNANESPETQNRNSYEIKHEPVKQDIQNQETEELTLINSETKYAKDIAVAAAAAADSVSREFRTEGNKTDFSDEIVTTVKPAKEITPKISTRHRFPLSTRKKLRMRPMLNNTYKGQLSRDLMMLNARKYSHHRRNITKSKEWRDIIPSMFLNNISNGKNDTEEIEATTFGYVQEETTVAVDNNNNNNSSEEIRPEEYNNSKLDDIDIDPTESPDISTKEILTEVPKLVTDKPTVVPKFRPPVNSSGLRRQAFNNRLKRKRLKHKNATTEPPQDDLIKHLFGLGSLVSSSEFIAKTEEPKSFEEGKDLTTMEDFVTTESTRKPDNHQVQNRVTKMSTVPELPPSTTEEAAKIEIEEILNDTQTSVKLSQILMERNMTLGQLVEHRERGSSHVHLADIFHNASREPNPPEPFLSKSLIEPISKEIYPLRALLDANLHEPNTKVTTDDPGFFNNMNIPVVMDFRNNVNENAENMGIMSLFNNFTKAENTTTVTSDSEEKVKNTTADPVPVTVANVTTISESARESRVFNENQDDIVSWNEIFSLMGRNQHNDTALNNFDELSPLKPFKKIRLDEDADGDGLIVLEDLQHLKDFESNIASGSDEKIVVNAYENKEHRGSGILDKIPSQTKSVTVATASIAGLAMILFLLTYAAFKWKQQRSAIRKKRNFADERIPTPVFENRKGHKHNSSTRSISPMLQTSNIYTLNTLDSQNGKESPDYMWDTLRKPFQ